MKPLIIFTMVAIPLIGLVVFYLTFRMIRKNMQKMPSVALRQGRKNALVCLVGLVLAIVVITLAIRSIFDWPFGQSTFAALGLLSAFSFVAFIGAWFRSKSKAGPLVLDCGEHPTKGLFLFNAVMWSIFAALLSVGILAAAFLGQNDLLIRILVALWLATFAFYWFIMAFGRLQILENGIWIYVDLLKWDRIGSYDWLGEEKRTLMFRTKTKMPFLGRGALPVPLEHRDAVDELLRKYVPDCEVGEASNDAESTSPRFHKIWIEQCEAAEEIEGEFAIQKALDYLIGEKFLNFLEAAETDPDFRTEIPAFVAKIKEIFERWQLAQYLETARETEPFDPSLFDGDEETDAEEVEDMRRDDIRQCTRELLLVERAREWLLEEGGEYGDG